MCIVKDAWNMTLDHILLLFLWTQKLRKRKVWNPKQIEKTSFRLLFFSVLYSPPDHLTTLADEFLMLFLSQKQQWIIRKVDLAEQEKICWKI